MKSCPVDRHHACGQRACMFIVMQLGMEKRTPTEVLERKYRHVSPVSVAHERALSQRFQAATKNQLVRQAASFRGTREKSIRVLPYQPRMTVHTDMKCLFFE